MAGGYYANKGDPILSADGKTVVGRWRETKLMPYPSLRWEVPVNGRVKVSAEDMPAAVEKDAVDIVGVSCSFTSPAASIWRFDSGNIDYRKALRALGDAIEVEDDQTEIRRAAQRLTALPMLPAPEAKLIEYIAERGWSQV